MHEQENLNGKMLLHQNPQAQEGLKNSSTGFIRVNKRDGSEEFLDEKKIYASLHRATKGIPLTISFDLITKEVIKNMYDNAATHSIDDALILATLSFIERDPSYSIVASRLLRQKLSKEVFQQSVSDQNYHKEYQASFIKSIEAGVKQETIDARLLTFDLPYLAAHLKLERDDLIEYLGLRTLYERYFCKVNGLRAEMPQAFWMRIAMGLSLFEENKNERALEFYEVISQLLYVPSTPTLLHAGTTHPQLSSCYLTTITDDLDHIFKCLGDNAQMSRWSGGIANDWTYLRATGSYIKSIRSGSQGVVPFLKIANDVTAAINRSGSRRGASVAYLEAWHYDFEDFIDLRRNTGDERRRTHDMNTASWIPDLLMKRINQNGTWTLFSPNDTPDLHDLYGKAFEDRYVQYEQMVQDGVITLFKTMPAAELWKKILTRLFETGHPWITFKDACNVRSPQDHVGVVHSSNLCTEITLNTSADETAVCNLGSINLARMITSGTLDKPLFAKTIDVAMRMLDNVIDINFYPTKEGKNSNMRHRPTGLGLMGLQDALYMLNINFDSKEALEFSDNLGELFSYNTILASSKLAKERGAYQSFKGSKWDRNIFPIDTLDLLEKERGATIEVSRTSILDWTPVRDHVKQYGMRNSNTMAIAPTATISNISGCYPCIEPIYKNIYVKVNMGGEFTVINKYLIDDLKKLNLWNQEMLDYLKYYDGNISMIDAIPQPLKAKYKEAFEIDPFHQVHMTALRSKWIDQSQSHNVFMFGVSGKKLDEIYQLGWRLGMKTFYYLRTLAASQIEKSTLDAKKFGFTQKREYKSVDDINANTSTLKTEDNAAQENDLGVKACSLENPECESCQ